MKCNSCWQDLEGRAIATTCGHIFCTEDASKILSSDSTCPLCEQMLSKSKMKAVDMTPSDEWINMVMAGVPPQSIMKSAFKGVIFWIGQKDVEVQLSVNKALHFRQKCEQMQGAYSQKMSQVEEAYTGKLQQVHSGYQKAMKKIQAMDQERESLAKDKEELQEKYTEKSRQKRKLEEMYDALRKEYELVKRSAAPPMNNNKQAMIQRPNPYAFASNLNAFDEPRHQSAGIAPTTPASTADLWPPRQEAQTRPFDLPTLPQSLGRQQGSRSASRGFSGGSPNMFKSSHSLFNTSGGGQASDTFRNLLRSPSLKHPQARPRGL